MTQYKTLTVAQAKKLQYGDELWDKSSKDSRGNPVRWVVKGMVKRWVNSPDKIQVGLKHGLYDHFQLTNSDIHLLSTDDHLRTRLASRKTIATIKTKKAIPDKKIYVTDGGQRFVKHKNKAWHVRTVYKSKPTAMKNYNDSVIRGNKEFVDVVKVSGGYAFIVISPKKEYQISSSALQLGKTTRFANRNTMTIEKVI